MCGWSTESALTDGVQSTVSPSAWNRSLDAHMRQRRAVGAERRTHTPNRAPGQAGGLTNKRPIEQTPPSSLGWGWGKSLFTARYNLIN